MPLQVFISYAHEDLALRKKLETHLSLLVRRGDIASWTDSDISPGTEWEPQIMDRLNKADIILLLISADFMASDFCYGIEMKHALARHKANNARVVPIILRPVFWMNAPFSGLQALPRDGKAVTSWPSQDEAFQDVVEGIASTVEELRRIRQTP